VKYYLQEPRGDRGFITTTVYKQGPVFLWAGNDTPHGQWQPGSLPKSMLEKLPCLDLPDDLTVADAARLLRAGVSSK